MNDRNTYLELLNKHKIPKDTFDVSTAKELVNQIYDEIDDEKLYIGLKDVEDNKIYADSSIVEFEYIKSKHKGYFTWNNKTLSYDIMVIDWNFKILKNYSAPIGYSHLKMKNFKIIDTIQENKLGLIK
tara:strand:- start:174 stop:557 length:384 start_codon:yes stop_codon:yes gene_type:complete